MLKNDDFLIHSQMSNNDNGGGDGCFTVILILFVILSIITWFVNLFD